MLNRRSWSAGAVLGGLLLPGSVHAAEIDSLMPLSLEEILSTPVVTASRHSESRAHTPAHIIVITRDEIRDRRYNNLADLLEDLPGVDFQRGTRSTQYNNFSFQGKSSNNKLLIMLDGVRIDHPAGGKIPVAENFPLYMAKQVEVLYGPAAALYGADAVSGVINIISEKPADTKGVWVSIGGGRFDSRQAAALAGARLAEDVTLSVGAHRQHSDRAPLDHYYPSAFPKVDATTFDGTVAVPAAQREHYTGPIDSGSDYARLDIGRDLSFGYFANHFRSLTSTGDRPDTALYLDSAYWDTRIETYYGRYRFDLSPSLSGELLVDSSHLHVAPASRYVNIYTDFQDNGYDYTKAWRRSIEQNFTWTLNARHSLLAGLGFSQYYALETPDLPGPYDTALGPTSQGYVYANTDLPLQGMSARYRNRSAYLQWQADWTPDWSTTIGARYDKHSAYGGSTNPRLGVVWQYTPGSYLKLLYGESFRAPSPEDSLSAFGSFSGAKDAAGNYVGTGFRVPNPDLRPETARSWSLTWDWRPRRDLNLVANAYTTRIDNVIVTRDEIVSTQYIAGAVLSNTTIKDNIGSEHDYGLDLMLRWSFALGGPWRADLWGSYSYLRGSVTEDDSGIVWDQTNIARNKLKLGLTLRYGERYTITPRWLLVDDTTTGRKDKNDPGSRLTTPGYGVLDLHLGAHKLFDHQGLSAYVDIYNLTDRRYSAAHGAGSTTFVSMPQQPRTWMLTLEQQF